MKKATAILFLTIYLLTTTEAQQLLKLPAVFYHYQEHQKEDNHISFFKFLTKHYLHGSPKDKDYEEDMKLPFKTCGDCISAIAPAFVPAMVQLSVTKPIEICVNKNQISQDQFILSTYLSNIWQPPKFC